MREAEPYIQRDELIIARAEALSQGDRVYVLSVGGIDGLERHLAELGDTIKVSDQIQAIAASINRREPMPNPSIVLHRPRSTPVPDDYRRRGSDGMTYAPIRDTGRHPITFTDFGGRPRVVLPSEPSNWAELRADLTDWATEMGRGASAEQTRAKAIVLKAEPAPEYSFDGLLPVYVRSMGDNWLGRTDNHKRTIKVLKEVLGNIEYRDVRRKHAIQYRDKLESLGSYGWQKGHLERASALFAAAISGGKMPDEVERNPFYEVGVRGTEEDVNPDKAQTDLFTVAQLQTILAKAREIHWGDTRREKRHTETMWLLEVMTYSGMRPNEVLQLQRGDVYVEPESSVKVFHIHRKCCVTGTRHPLKSMKNPKLRDVYVPLHPKIEAFFDFANAGPDKAAFMFACFPYTGAGKKRRSWFDTNFCKLLKTCEIEPKPGKKLSLYSIGRLFHRAMDNVEIVKKRQEVITSHAPQDEHDKYSRGADLKLLAADVAKIDPLA